MRTQASDRKLLTKRMSLKWVQSSLRLHLTAYLS